MGVGHSFNLTADTTEFERGFEKVAMTLTRLFGHDLLTKMTAEEKAEWQKYFDQADDDTRPQHIVGGY